MTFQSQYTLAKNLSDAGDDYEVNVSGINTLDPFNRSLDMANVSYQPRHRWVTSAVYELPLGAASGSFHNPGGAIDALISGWSVTGVFDWQTGQPQEIAVR